MNERVNNDANAKGPSPDRLKQVEMLLNRLESLVGDDALERKFGGRRRPEGNRSLFEAVFVDKGGVAFSGTLDELIDSGFGKSRAERIKAGTAEKQKLLDEAKAEGFKLFCQRPLVKAALAQYPGCEGLLLEAYDSGIGIGIATVMIDLLKSK